jgi:hypothetical protein
MSAARRLAIALLGAQLATARRAQLARYARLFREAGIKAD